jgi:hypothetical protein
VTSRTLNGEIRAYLYIDLTSICFAAVKKRYKKLQKALHGRRCNLLALLTLLTFRSF